MTTQLDTSVGIKKESTWGTAVTVDHFPEFLSETLEWKPTFMQGKGFRAGSRVSRLERRALGKNSVGGDIELECVSRGMGIFLEALFGAVTSTQISAGPAYQHNYTLTTTDPMPSYTIQKGIPLLGGGAVQPHTFSGMVCDSGTITSAVGDIVKLKTSWVGKALDTAAAYAAPSYVASNELFTFTQGALTIGGTVTQPTTTALATGGTSVANVLDFSLTVDNKLDANGYTYGNGGKQGRRPALALAEIKGKFTAEFDAVTYRDAYLNQTTLSIVLTFTTTTLLQAGVYNTMQIVVPNVKLGGSVPNAQNGVITTSVDFEVLDGGASGVSPVTVVLRSLDVTP